jgi:hypothetical protein
MNQNVKTSLGVAIIIIIAITVGVFTWKAMNVKESVAPVTNVQSKNIAAKSVKAVDQTADWKTYTNEKYGFEYKYPKTWTLDVESSKINPNIQKNCGPSITGEKDKNTCLDSVAFEIVQNSEMLSLNKLWEKNGWKNGQDYKNLKEYKVGNLIAYTTTMISSYDSSENLVFWVPLSDGNFFKLNGSYLIDDEKDVFSEMVSSFRFTK